MALVDSETGEFLSAKRHGQLLEAFARTEADGSVVIRLPDGAEVDTRSVGASAALSDWLGRAVELRRPAAGISPEYTSFADSTDETSATTTFRGPSSHFADFADLHLLTTSSLRAAKALRPAADWDMRRFRPTVLVDADDGQTTAEGFVEDGWVGSRVVLGSDATFEIFMMTIRCNLPTRAQPSLPRDTSVARVLRDEHDFCLGVYGAFRRAGVVSTGDAVVLQPA